LYALLGLLESKEVVMYTIEHFDEDTVITTLDQSGSLGDVEVMIDDASVVIRQFSETRNSYDLIIMSAQQFKNILDAMNKPEGVYYA